jgi:hypothetical protein
MSPPPFHSGAGWASFVSEMGTLIRSYRKEAHMLWSGLLMPIGIICFNPWGFGIVPLTVSSSDGSNATVTRSNDTTLQMHLTMLSFGLGVLAPVFLMGRLRKQNQAIDEKIQAVCLAKSTPACTFRYVTCGTEPIRSKRKGGQIPTYRALVMAPVGAFEAFDSAGGAHEAQVFAGLAGATAQGAEVMAVPMAGAQPMVAQQQMQVVCPPNVSAGQHIQIATPSGQMLDVVVPPGVGPGQPFLINLPSTPPVALARAV